MAFASANPTTFPSDTHHPLVKHDFTTRDVVVSELRGDCKVRVVHQALAHLRGHRVHFGNRLGVNDGE